MPEDKDISPDADKTGIDWIDDTIPRSRRFGDLYYSRAGGQAETAHVFVEGNDLPARWPAMDTCLIAELGFGTGLNFLETLRQWQQCAPANASLSFVSFEQFPLSRADLARALSRWPQLEADAKVLVDNWNPDFEMLSVGFGDNAELIVFLGDAGIRLSKLDFTADVWYLDGFAPDRNPEMWSPALMARVFAHARPGATFATYAAASSVRKNLQAAGFEVERRQGFGGKREMLCGRRPE